MCSMCLLAVEPRDHESLSDLLVREAADEQLEHLDLPRGESGRPLTGRLTWCPRRRFAPHQLRHAHAVELDREGVPLNTIQRQLGHANLGTTSIYLQGNDPEEIIATVHTRRAPMMSATAGPSDTLVRRRRAGVS